MTTKDIQQLLSNGEHITLECKLAEKSLPKSVWETYSAFANTIGGKILLGIKEQKEEQDPAKRFTINGVSNANQIVKDFWNTVHSNKVSANILYDHDVEKVEIDGKTIICINVPQADWRVRPIYINEQLMKGTYKRNHEGDYHCTESEIRMMIRDANEDGNDGMLLENFTMDDIDLESLHRYRNVFASMNIAHPWNEVDDKTFLLNLNGYQVDRKNKQEGLTVAGLMMFGKGRSVRERFGNFRMDYLDMSNLIEGERWRDRLTYDGRWENNFFQFFNIVLPKLISDLPRPFRLKDGVQRIDDTPQITAVREAITNSIIHCDIFAPAGLLCIERHDDKLVLRNPGTLLIPIDRVYTGGHSKARNPRIQTFLRMIGYGENIGSGFPKIIKAWQDAGWETPLLENDLITNEVTLTLYMPIKGENEEMKQEMKQEMEQEMKQEMKQILQMMTANPEITRSELVEKTHKSNSTVFRMIEKLKSGNYIKRIGPTKGGYWEILKPM